MFMAESKRIFRYLQISYFLNFVPIGRALVPQELVSVGVLIGVHRVRMKREQHFYQWLRTLSKRDSKTAFLIRRLRNEGSTIQF